MEGMFEGRSVHLSRIASHVGGRACKLSVVAQLNRFLGNGSVAVRGGYEPSARELLRQAAAAGQVILILDSTEVGVSAQLVMGSLDYQGRALPLICAGVPYPKGHTLDVTPVGFPANFR